MKHPDPLVITNFTRMRNQLKKQVIKKLEEIGEYDSYRKGNINSYVTRAWDVLARNQPLVPGVVSNKISLSAEVQIIPIIEKEFAEFKNSLRIFLDKSSVVK